MGGTQISGRSDPLGFSHGFSLHADTVAYANPAWWKQRVDLDTSGLLKISC